PTTPRSTSAWSAPRAGCGCSRWPAGRRRCSSASSPTSPAAAPGRRCTPTRGTTSAPSGANSRRSPRPPIRRTRWAPTWSIRRATGTWPRMLEALGTREAGALSVMLYGHPRHPLPGGGPSAREAAAHFIGIADELDRELIAPEEQVRISATALQLQLQNQLDAFFGGRVVSVELDPDLIAKAAA